MDDEALLAEQVAFYRARACTYDEWWQRRGAYDRGSDMAAEWNRQIARIERALDEFAVSGNVLELAGGTGWWTERLARAATRLTVVDSSPEALDRNRSRTGRRDIEYRVADLFSWTPETTYDVVFFSFWLSHVPRSRVAAFWSMVGSSLAPGGRVFFIDNREDPETTQDITDPYVCHYEPDRHIRRLDDGRHYNVVKVMYEPDELQMLLEGFGWEAATHATRWFIFGSARRGDDAPATPSSSS